MNRSLIRSILRHLLPTTVERSYAHETCIINVPLPGRGQTKHLLLQLCDERTIERIALLKPQEMVTTRFTVYAIEATDSLISQHFDHQVSLDACVDIAIHKLESDYGWLGRL